VFTGQVPKKRQGGPTNLFLAHNFFSRDLKMYKSFVLGIPDGFFKDTIFVGPFQLFFGSLKLNTPKMAKKRKTPVINV
jgi:hypothetical protein